MSNLGVFIKEEITDDNESIYKSNMDTLIKKEMIEENDSNCGPFCLNEELLVPDVVPTVFIKQETEEQEEEEELNIYSDTKRETKDFLKMEAELRIARINKQMLYDKELHALRIKEAKVKLQMAEAELEILRLRKELLLKDSNKN